jgi:hypothetical protein
MLLVAVVGDVAERARGLARRWPGVAGMGFAHELCSLPYAR